MHHFKLLPILFILFAATSQVTAQPYVPPITAQPSAPQPSAPSYPFEVKITGSGKQSILFIPGLACSGAVWDETLPNYQSKYTCHTLTMAGFAGVPAQTAPSLDAWVEAIASYIKDRHIDHPIIIGHSIGGGMALMLAARHPELISSIIVVDALPCLAAANNPAFKTQENPHCDEMVARMTKTSDEQFLQSEKRFIPSLVADTAYIARIIQWGVQSDRKTFASLFCQFGNTDLRETISSIQCPALILLEAPFANIKPVVEAQYAKLKTASLQYADKGRHFIMYDDKNWYLQQIDHFLKK